MTPGDVVAKGGSKRSRILRQRMQFSSNFIDLDDSNIQAAAVKSLPTSSFSRHVHQQEHNGGGNVTMRRHSEGSSQLQQQMSEKRVGK